MHVGTRFHGILASVHADQETHVGIPDNSFHSGSSDRCIGGRREVDDLLSPFPLLATVSDNLFHDIESHEGFSTEEGQGEVPNLSGDVAMEVVVDGFARRFLTHGSRRLLDEAIGTPKITVLGEIEHESLDGGMAGLNNRKFNHSKTPFFFASAAACRRAVLTKWAQNSRDVGRPSKASNTC